MLKNKEIAHEEFKILPKESKIQGGIGELDVAIWKETRVLLKRVNTHTDPRTCYKNFVHEVSINILIIYF